MIFIGIDPGKNGGIAVLSEECECISLVKMPSTPLDILNHLRQFKEHSICLIEKVGARPNNGAKAMFTFGQGYGHLEMALLALEIPTHYITPQKWEKYYQLGNSAQNTKTQWKNKLKAKAQAIYPSVKNITLATADALLIAYYHHQSLKRL